MVKKEERESLILTGDNADLGISEWQKSFIILMHPLILCQAIPEGEGRAFLPTVAVI
jgi:hypothetical protein